jgi:hypothetical protein
MHGATININMVRVYGLGSSALEYTAMAGICESGDIISVLHNEGIFSGR